MDGRVGDALAGWPRDKQDSKERMGYHRVKEVFAFLHECRNAM